jgi:hypothetical protein
MIAGSVPALIGPKFDPGETACAVIGAVNAWDMCDLNQDPASNELDPRISADGWTVVGIITGRDNVLATALSVQEGVPPENAGLRQSMVRPGADIRRYGYLAVNAAGDTYVAAIRGTDGAEEWIDDVVFIAERRAQFPGRVERGFTDIYLSMEYRPLAGGSTVPLAEGIKAAVGEAGHSSSLRCDGASRRISKLPWRGRRGTSGEKLWSQCRTAHQSQATLRPRQRLPLCHSAASQSKHNCRRNCVPLNVQT